MLEFIQSTIFIIAGFLLIFVGLWSAQGAFASSASLRKTDQKFVATLLFLGGLVCLFVAFSGIELIRHYA